MINVGIIGEAKDTVNENNITIINGNGSYLNPYILGGELNEEENNNN